MDGLTNEQRQQYEMEEDEEEQVDMEGQDQEQQQMDEDDEDEDDGEGSPEEGNNGNVNGGQGGNIMSTDDYEEIDYKICGELGNSVFITNFKQRRRTEHWMSLHRLRAQREQSKFVFNNSLFVRYW